MVTRRRRTGAPRPRRRRTSASLPHILPPIPPDVARSIFGVVLLVMGAVTLIALALPGQGRLTDLWRDSIAPWFQTGRWLLPFLLLGAGWYVEWGPGKRPNSGWGLTVFGLAVAFTGFLGAFEVLDVEVFGIERGGGRIGRFLASLLAPLLTAPGAFVVLIAIGIVGLLLAFNLRLRDLARPGTRLARWFGTTAAASLRRDENVSPRDRSRAAAPGAADVAANDGLGRAPRAIPSGASPGQTGMWGGNGEENGRPAIPSAVPSSAPVSATFAPSVVLGGTEGAVAVAAPPRAPAVPRDPFDVTDVSDGTHRHEEPPYDLPPITLLDDIAARTGGAAMDHERNAAIITGKLAGFNIPARVTRWNAGPVVTQYEIDPDPSVKVSRIEGLADDLAMALAARTIRIEAPIPGKSVVGLEIPNSDFNVVALRRILEEVDFAASGSRLTFALGRDVAGHARAADLAKMPHLLIAGATGSGKSVMVNALIASLLCKATPDDVRLILTDLKRVELAAYNGLPHLLVPVITEPGAAKAALKWAVQEMEARYRKFAGATARNIATYNETRADPADRLPYIVIIVDELADLMMREGKNVEDPVVRLAQKARATGIHMVLATQRPSVNVVTGLIKANFPSRIAFAMASQIDSRTIIDAPGAEDLIGRGDMLFQPADLPRPVRLQGVFVSDKEIGKIVDHWRSWTPHYDVGIVENDEEPSGGTDDLFDEEADRLLPDAVSVVQEYDRASASLLQRRLKIGYARAARIIDQLEARGYIGAFDGSNARQVLRREGGPAGSPSDRDRFAREEDDE
jgi:DNA segregation ATPase FtsK/SpoIIIE, S-DNA-T family